MNGQIIGCAVLVLGVWLLVDQLLDIATRPSKPGSEAFSHTQFIVLVIGVYLIFLGIFAVFAEFRGVKYLKLATFMLTTMGKGLYYIFVGVGIFSIERDLRSETLSTFLWIVAIATTLHGISLVVISSTRKKAVRTSRLKSKGEGRGLMVVDDDDDGGGDTGGRSENVEYETSQTEPPAVTSATFV